MRSGWERCWLCCQMRKARTANADSLDCMCDLTIEHTFIQFPQKSFHVTEIGHQATLAGSAQRRTTTLIWGQATTSLNKRSAGTTVPCFLPLGHSRPFVSSSGTLVPFFNSSFQYKGSPPLQLRSWSRCQSFASQQPHQQLPQRSYASRFFRTRRNTARLKLFNTIV
jgi:hypothetical protein